MKLARFQGAHGPVTGLRTASGVIDLSALDAKFDDFAWALTAGGQARARELNSGSAASAAEPKAYLPPLAAGARLICVEVNYAMHAGDNGRTRAAQPAIYLRSRQSVVGHEQALRKPGASNQFDFGGGLGVMIGRFGRNLGPAEALEVVAGYTCFNDGSLRDFQRHSLAAGKNFDASGAVGPWVVTADEIPDPADLTLTTRLNGIQVQRARTDLMIHGVPAILQYLSSFMELRTGDLIATGTPAGVGALRSPPMWMEAGDSIEVEISGIGLLRNSIVAA